MFSRRSFILSALTTPALAFMATRLLPKSVMPYSAMSYSTGIIPDREVALHLSTAMRQQLWMYAGQRYQQVSDEIVVNEDESVRFHISNDTSEPRHIVLHGLETQLPVQEQFDYSPVFERLEPGATVIIGAMVKTLGSAALLDLEGRVQRLIRVRSCDQAHPFV